MQGTLEGNKHNGLTLETEEDGIEYKYFGYVYDGTAIVDLTVNKGEYCVTVEIPMCWDYHEYSYEYLPEDVEWGFGPELWDGLLINREEWEEFEKYISESGLRMEVIEGKALAFANEYLK